MDYGNLLSRAWKIVWANKWLFVLGFLAALGGGGGGSGGSNFNPGTSGGGSSTPSTEEIFDTLGEFLPFIIAGICILVALAIGLWLLRLIGEAGMIASVDRIEGGETLTLKDGFRAGTSHLKQMIVLNLILYGPFLLFGLLTVGVFVLLFAGGASTGSGQFLASGLGIFALCAIPLACILSIAIIIVRFVYPMAQRGMILNQLAVRDSIRHGWDILRNNLGEIIILAVIFVLIGIVVGLASLFIALPLAAIFIVPIILAAIQGSAVITAATVIFAIIGVIIFILISAAVNSIIRTFQSATFTLAYHQWAGKSPKSVSAAL